MASYLRPVGNNETHDPKILLIDADLNLIKCLSETLSNYGFLVQHATNWPTMVKCLRETVFDLLIIEQRLGRVDMVHHLVEILPLTKAPLIFLTGNPVEADRILALELGAADFLQKPMSGRELVARVRAHLRRVPASPRGAEPQQAAWRMACTERRLYTPSGTKVPLTVAEFALLEHLVKAAGRPMARDGLTQEVLQRPYRAEDRSIDNLVYQVRQKIGRAGGGDTIIAVRGQGYAFIGFASAPTDPMTRSASVGQFDGLDEFGPASC